MGDVFVGHQSGLDSPAEHAASVTPSDSTDLATSARCLYVGTTGNVKVDTVAGETVTDPDEEAETCIVGVDCMPIVDEEK